MPATRQTTGPAKAAAAWLQQFGDALVGGVRGRLRRDELLGGVASLLLIRG